MPPDLPCVAGASAWRNSAFVRHPAQRKNWLRVGFVSPVKVVLSGAPESLNRPHELPIGESLKLQARLGVRKGIRIPGRPWI